MLRVYEHTFKHPQTHMHYHTNFHVFSPSNPMNALGTLIQEKYLQVGKSINSRQMLEYSNTDADAVAAIATDCVHSLPSNSLSSMKAHSHSHCAWMRKSDYNHWISCVFVCSWGEAVVLVVMRCGALKTGCDNIRIHWKKRSNIATYMFIFKQLPKLRKNWNRTEK